MARNNTRYNSAPNSDGGSLSSESVLENINPSEELIEVAPISLETITTLASTDNTPDLQPVIAPSHSETRDDAPGIASASLKQERSAYLNDWLKTVRGFEPEVIGTFGFIARQNGWIVNTPSEWNKKLLRWLNEGDS